MSGIYIAVEPVTDKYLAYFIVGAGWHRADRSPCPKFRPVSAHLAKILSVRAHYIWGISDSTNLSIFSRKSGLRISFFSRASFFVAIFHAGTNNTRVAFPFEKCCRILSGPDILDDAKVAADVLRRHTLSPPIETYFGIIPLNSGIGFI